MDVHDDDVGVVVKASTSSGRGGQGDGGKIKFRF